MRFAFGPVADKLRDLVERVIPKPMPVADKPVVRSAAPSIAGDLDLGAIGRALARKKRWIIIPTLLVAVLSVITVNLITPRYKSEARILIDGRENVFLRPNGERNDERAALDPEAVTSQVQLLLSRDLARMVIKKNKLAQLPEFDPVLRGVSPIKWVLSLFGIGRDPFSLTPEERVLDSFFDRYTAYAVDKSRVVVVEFQSQDPDLAARVANSIADSYLTLQQDARQQQARAASQWLSGEIDNLRKRVADDEAKVEDFRSKSSLFVGTNNTTLSNQQLGELNTQLNNARALKSDAEAKARLIRQMLQSGRPIEASEVLNSELIRRLSEQRVTLRAQLAEQSSTLLPGHPRIKELKAQLADLDGQIREEAGKIARSLENDAQIASGRVDALSASLDQLKRQATSTNDDDVKLRALEREAKAQRDLLEAYLAKYREANTRENIDAAPGDGRIISRAIVSNSPAYPKKLPIVLIATLATLMLTGGTIATGELLRMTAPRPATERMEATFVPVAAEDAPPVPPVSASSFDPPEANPEPAREHAGIESADPAEPSELERLADELCAAGEAARKVTILGTAPGESIASTALTLARLMARKAKVVLVDLSAASRAISEASVDPGAPGLAELMLGEVSFSEVITRDRLSRVQLVNSGRPGSDQSLLQSPRLSIAIDALLRVYDHVLLDVGTGSDLSAEMLTSQAKAVFVPDASMPSDARDVMCGHLKAVGFSDVKLLREPAAVADAAGSGPRAAA
ncbi:MAG TPA: exopolysaccharide transport family protein [Bradyrhizobium sp.]|nr:exopolysaccharide transport family protein [Bradyrhizobium sp.]